MFSEVCNRTGVRNGCGVFVNRHGDKYSGQWQVSSSQAHRTSYTLDDYCLATSLPYISSSSVFCLLQMACSQDDKRHGEGEYSWHTCDRYVGQWQLGSMSGTGTFHWHNGDQFTGGWLDGHMHGTGTKTLHNGDVITGTWQHGRQQGKGTKLFACGDKHTGLYKDDR